MAKIKVHEIAKEMEKQSREIIAFQQDKGIEVKAAQSSLEEDAAEMVRKAFGKAKPGAGGVKSGALEGVKAAAKYEERPAAGGKPEASGAKSGAAGAKSAASESGKPETVGTKQETAKSEPASGSAAANSAAANGNAMNGREQRPAAGGEQPKKKKKIIVVSNPRNSNIPGQQRPSGERRAPQGQGGRQGNRPAGGDSPRIRDREHADRRHPTKSSAL